MPMFYGLVLDEGEHAVAASKSKEADFKECDE
jgi:hypothetical protein